MDDKDIIVIEVARRGRDGDYAGATEVAALKLRATALEARADITSLDAVPNVSAPSPSSGQVLSWNGSAWVPVTVPNGIRVAEGGTIIEDPVTTMDFYPNSFDVENPSEGWARLNPRFAGSGSAHTFARSDHGHTTPSTIVETFGHGGYMSSGSRPLASMSVVLAEGVTYLVQTRLNMQMRGADPGQCQYRLALTVGGSTHESPAGANGFWCVQGVPDKTMWMYPRTIVGTGAAISISAAVSYYGGGGFNTDAGEIEVTLIPNK